MTIKPAPRTPGKVTVEQTPAEASKAALLTDCANAGVKVNRILDNGYNSFAVYATNAQIPNLRKVLEAAGCKKVSDTYYGAPSVAWQDSNNVKFIIISDEPTGGAAVMRRPGNI